MGFVAGALVVGGVAGAAASGKPKIPKPDALIGQAQMQMADLAVRQQDWYENEISPMLMEQLEQQTATAKITAEANVKAMDFQTAEAQKYSERYWGTQVPLEDKLISKALAYNEKGEQERMAAQAGADVEQALAQGQTGLTQSLRARGVDLGSGSAVAALTEMNTQAVMAKAGAINRTRETARQMGWQRLGEATALGKGLPSFGQGSTQLAIGAAGGANSAAGSGTAGVATAAGVGQNQLGAQGSIYGNIGSIGANVYGTQMQGAKIAAENDPMQAIYGQMVGIGTSYFTGSDRRLKKNIRHIGRTARGHKWYRWDWRDGSGSSEGVIAQEVAHVPGAVARDERGFLMVDYSRVT